MSLCGAEAFSLVEVLTALSTNQSFSKGQSTSLPTTGTFLGGNGGLGQSHEVFTRVSVSFSVVSSVLARMCWFLARVDFYFKVTDLPQKTVQTTKHLYVSVSSLCFPVFLAHLGFCPWEQDV